MNDQFNQLVQYIKQHLQQGVAEDSIRQTLLQHNWNAELVERAFGAAKQLPAPPPAPTEVGAHTTQPASPQAPSKYTVLQATTELFAAIKNNPAAFFAGVIVSCIVAVLALFLIASLAAIVYGQMGMLAVVPMNALFIFAGSLIAYNVWYVLANAFILSVSSLAIADGMQGRKSAIGALFRASFKTMGRIAAANTLFTIVTFWPIMLAIFLPFLFIGFGPSSGPTALVVMPLLMLVAIVWIYIALVRFALVPYVALFEPHVPVLKTLGRSKYLLTKGGQWFLVKCVLIIVATMLLLGAATGRNVQQIIDNGDLGVNLILLFVFVVANGVLVMLYKNRATVRG